jgi:hypothetical protein
MKPKILFREYLNQRLTGEELQLRLAKDSSRDASELREILNMEESCRHVLREFAASAEARQHLVEKVVAVESWIRDKVQQQNPAPSPLFTRILPAFDVVGHATAGKKTKKRQKTKESATQSRSLGKGSSRSRPRKR